MDDDYSRDDSPPPANEASWPQPVFSLPTPVPILPTPVPSAQTATNPWSVYDDNWTVQEGDSHDEPHHEPEVRPQSPDRSESFSLPSAVSALPQPVPPPKPPSPKPTLSASELNKLPPPMSFKDRVTNHLSKSDEVYEPQDGPLWDIVHKPKTSKTDSFQIDTTKSFLDKDSSSKQLQLKPLSSLTEPKAKPATGFNAFLDQLINKLSKGKPGASAASEPPPPPPSESGAPRPPPPPSEPPPPPPPDEPAWAAQVDDELMMRIMSEIDYDLSEEERARVAREKLAFYLGNRPNPTHFLAAPPPPPPPRPPPSEASIAESDISSFMSRWCDSGLGSTEDDRSTFSSGEPALSSALAKLRAKKMQPPQNPQYYPGSSYQSAFGGYDENDDDQSIVNPMFANAAAAAARPMSEEALNEASLSEFLAGYRNQPKPAPVPFPVPPPHVSYNMARSYSRLEVPMDLDEDDAMAPPPFDPRYAHSLQAPPPFDARHAHPPHVPPPPPPSLPQPIRSMQPVTSQQSLNVAPKNVSAVEAAIVQSKSRQWQNVLASDWSRAMQDMRFELEVRQTVFRTCNKHFSTFSGG
jgi:hypothetical protein